VPLRIKPIRFEIDYYRDRPGRGTVMVSDAPERPADRPSALADHIRDMLPPDVPTEVLPQARVGRQSDVVALRESLEPDVDAMVLTGSVDQALWARVCDLGIPILFMAHSGLWRTFMEDGGWEHHMPDEEVGFEALVAALALRKSLRDMNALYIGPLPSIAIAANCWDLEAIRAVFGVHFIQVEVRELLAIQETVPDSEADAVLSGWEEHIGRLVEPSREDVLEVAKLYVAMRRLLAREEATGLAVSCGRLTEVKFLPPCLAMSMLIDEGIPSACGDTNSLLVMTSLMQFSGGPALMGNFTVWPEENQVSIHHDVLAPSLATAPLDLFGFHRRGEGVTGYADLRTGEPATVCGLSRDLGEMLVIGGSVARSENMVHCRTRVFIDIEDASAIRHARVGHHYTMVYGDVRERMRALGRVLGVGVRVL